MVTEHVTGTMQTGKVVHAGKLVKIKNDVKLYGPICSRMQFRTLCYLFVTGETVTCKKCLAKEGE